MKKSFTILAIALSAIAFSQEFILTPENFKNKDDESKNYIVLEYPDLNQKQLFDKAKMFIHSKYKNLKSDGLNEVEFSQLKLRSRVAGTTVKMLGMEGTSSYLVTTTELNFKDGKIMIKPHFDEFEPEGRNRMTIYLTGGSGLTGKSVFNKDGKVWLDKYYTVANEKTNEFVNELKNAISTSDNW